MEKKVFVISTRKYPKNDNAAWEKKIFLEINLNSIDREFRETYYENQSDYYEASQVIIKRQEFNPYCVFVVPCLNGAAEKKKRYSFLNKLIDLICKIESVTVDNVILIAHDKDFGADKNLCNVVATDDIDKKYVVLRSLMQKKQIFLFQHKPGRIYNIILKVPLTSNDSFSIDSCNELYALCKKINS